MKVAVAASVILVLCAGAARGEHPSDVAQAIPAMISLYISCDLIAEFTMTPLDVDTVHRFDSLVSREGAQLHIASRQTRGWGVVRVPLMVDEASSQRMEDNHSKPLDVWRPNRSIRLMSARESVVDS